MASDTILFSHKNVEAFPVGSVFLSLVNTDPSILLGYGSWKLIGGQRMLMGCESLDDTGGLTGGNNSITLSSENLPSHSHSISQHTHQIPAHNHTASSDSKSHNHTITVGNGGSHNHTASSASSSHAHTITVNNGGTHTHNIKIFYNPRASYISDNGQWVLGHVNDNKGNTYDAARIDSGGTHTHGASSNSVGHSHTITVNSGGTHNHTASSSDWSHNHTVTVAAKEVFDTELGGPTSTGAVGSGTSIDITNQYLKVFIWQRTE